MEKKYVELDAITEIIDSPLVVNGMLEYPRKKLKRLIAGLPAVIFDADERRSHPFENDPFQIILSAFKALYPEKKFECYWAPVDAGPDGTAYGETVFGKDGEVTVFVHPELPVQDAAEVFAHELAHVAVGADHGHNEEWESCFDRIHKEYERIIAQKFGDSVEINQNGT